MTVDKADQNRAALIIALSLPEKGCNNIRQRIFDSVKFTLPETATEPEKISPDAWNDTFAFLDKEFAKNKDLDLIMSMNQEQDQTEDEIQAHDAGANANKDTTDTDLIAIYKHCYNIQYEIKKIREMHDYNLKLMKEKKKDENNSAKIMKEMEEMIDEGFNENMEEMYVEDEDELESLKVENSNLKWEKRNLERRMECITCGGEKKIALLPCGHVPYCYDCHIEALVTHLTDLTIPAGEEQECPICRRKIERTQELFF